MMRIATMVTIGLLCGVLKPQHVLAQDPEFSQFFAAPLHLNPAMAGMANGPRVNINYRNEWPGLGDGANGGFVSYLISYDQHIEAIKGGIGASFLADRVAGGSLNTYTAKAMYSFQARVSRNFGFRLAIEGAYTKRSLDWARIIERDLNNTLYRFNNLVNIPDITTIPEPEEPDISYFDAGVGVLVFSDKHFAGIGVKHLMTPNQSHRGDDFSLPVRFAGHAGTVLYLNEANRVYISPNVMGVFQSDFIQLIGGAIVNVDYLFGGLWFRHTISNSDAVIALVGFRKNIVKFGYSYDMTISGLKGHSGGVHELSLSFLIGGDDSSLNPRSRRGILHCPDIISF